jgi:hypothetical protein
MRRKRPGPTVGRAAFHASASQGPSGTYIQVGTDPDLIPSDRFLALMHEGGFVQRPCTCGADDCAGVWVKGETEGAAPPTEGGEGPPPEGGRGA